MSLTQIQIRLPVSNEHHGLRLDLFLKLHHRRRSRASIQKAIEMGAITLERTSNLAAPSLRPSSLVLAGDQVIVTSHKKPEPEVDFSYRILFEDKDLCVIDKPANLPVHPAGAYYFNTLLTHLRTKAFTQSMGSEQELYLVHRIDKETSGLIVLAKSLASCHSLTRQFRERKIEKTYLAITHGVPKLETFQVSLAMNRSRTSRIRLKMEIMPEEEGGQAAHTDFKRLADWNEYALIECHPKTGRQHQIRLHLAAIGHPIIGDKLYSLPEKDALKLFPDRPPSQRVKQETSWITPELESRLVLPRHALHASGLTLTHPSTGERLSFSSELPQDLSQFQSSANSSCIRETHNRRRNPF